MRLIDADKLEDVVYHLNFEVEQPWNVTRGEFKLIEDILYEFDEVKIEDLKEKGERNAPKKIEEN